MTEGRHHPAVFAGLLGSAAWGVPTLALAVSPGEVAEAVQSSLVLQFVIGCTAGAALAGLVTFAVERHAHKKDSLPVIEHGEDQWSSSSLNLVRAQIEEDDDPTGDLGRFRVNAFHEKGNIAGAFRLIPNEIQSINELGMPSIVTSFADFPRGLVLVTGPTGSGKSTTLAALVDKINREKTAHIITIEDPIEFTHKSIRSVIVQREVHYDTYSFSAALRSALREDPDVVLIGEMRDLETISAAITIAETGHLVFATLHTNSASQSIDRMIDVFPPHQQPQVRSQLSNILQAICAQRLVPAIGGGRVVAAEILIANPAVRSVIREGKTHQLDTIIQTGADQGMQTMDRTLVKLIQTGVITYDTAREFAVDLQEFERLARG